MLAPTDKRVAPATSSKVGTRVAAYAFDLRRKVFVLVTATPGSEKMFVETLQKTGQNQRTPGLLPMSRCATMYRFASMPWSSSFNGVSFGGRPG